MENVLSLAGLPGAWRTRFPETTGGSWCPHDEEHHDFEYPKNAGKPHGVE
jgi:hypothetical protein